MSQNAKFCTCVPEDESTETTDVWSRKAILAKCGETISEFVQST
jgi:hypothetical protein